MVIFKNTHRRGRFRSHDRNFKRNGDVSKFKSEFSTNTNFQRKAPGRNNHNAPKLKEKYNDLAREALANGDKILSENYFQHADHFARVIEEQENKRTIGNSEINKTEKKDKTEKEEIEKQIINN